MHFLWFVVPTRSKYTLDIWSNYGLLKQHVIKFCLMWRQRDVVQCMRSNRCPVVYSFNRYVIYGLKSFSSNWYFSSFCKFVYLFFIMFIDINVISLLEWDIEILIQNVSKTCGNLFHLWRTLLLRVFLATQ